MLLRLTDCDACPFTGTVNVTDVGDTRSSALLLTTSVTGITNGLFGAATLVDGLVAAMVMVPVQVAAARVVGFNTETVTAPLVTPGEPLIPSQLPHEVVATVAV